jgi:hypothetical protein
MPRAQQVLHFSERKWKFDVHHDRKANILRAVENVLERVVFL